MPYLLLPLLRLFDYEGRSRRREFWGYCGAVGIGLTLALWWDGHVHQVRSIGGVIGPTTVIVGVLLGLPLLAATVRRLHDTGRTAGALAINLMPVAGQLLMLCWLAGEGQRGANRFGVDPRGSERGPATRPIKPGFAR